MSTRGAALRAAIAASLRAVVPPGFDIRGDSGGFDVWQNGEFWMRTSGLPPAPSTLAEHAASIASHVQDIVCRATTEPWPRPAGTRGPIPGAAAAVRAGDLLIWFGDADRPVVACPPISLNGLVEPGIQLFPMTAARWRSAAQDPSAFGRAHELVLDATADLVRAVAEQTLALLARTGAAQEPWTGFLAVDQRRGVVGTCAFVAPPDEDGVVEIAYFTFPAFEGMGCATAMASALVERAGGEAAVRRIRAHTLPARNASTRILEKIGFARAGDAVDPDEGPVWRWERAPTA